MKSAILSRFMASSTLLGIVSLSISLYQASYGMFSDFAPVNSDYYIFIRSNYLLLLLILYVPMSLLRYNFGTQRYLSGYQGGLPQTQISSRLLFRQLYVPIADIMLNTLIEYKHDNVIVDSVVIVIQIIFNIYFGIYQYQEFYTKGMRDRIVDDEELK